MRPKSLQQSCGWHVARNFTSQVWHLAIGLEQDKSRLVEFLVCFAEQYSDALAPWGIQDQLYKSLISSIRSGLNPPVFLTAMLLFCPKVTVDQIAMITDRRMHSHSNGIQIWDEECLAILEVLTECHEKLSQKQSQRKEEERESYQLPTVSLVLEGIYFHDCDFLAKLLEKMPDLQHISLQHNVTHDAMKALIRYCKHLESICFLELSGEPLLFEKEIFCIFFGMQCSVTLQDLKSVLKNFADHKEFRGNLEFQFPNLRKLDIDEIYFDEDVLHDIYTLALLLQPQLTCFGKHTGLTKRILSNYKTIWSSMNERQESEASLHLVKAKFVDALSAPPTDGDLELNYLEEIAPMFENLVSVELQKINWTEENVARFCWLFANQVKTFSLGALPLTDMSCLSNVTHLRLTLRKHYSFGKMHVILDCCPSLQTLSIHPTLHHERFHRNHQRPERLLNMGQVMEEDWDIFERLLFAEIMGEVVDVQPQVNDEGLRHDQNEELVPWPEIPPPRIGREVILNHSGASKGKHHNLTTLRIASLCEAGRKPSEDFLRGVFERLPNLRNLCLGVWMGSLSQRRQFLTCTANALVSVVTDETLQEPLLPLLEQLCCLPSGTEQQMCQSLACLVKALPSLHTLVLPALDSFMLAPTLRYFQHSNVTVQYKCATDQVFSHWEPEH